jgi:hypothetical protein
VSRTEEYRAMLRTLEEWDDFLLRESRLPGPRANLELARAVAEEGDEALFEGYLALGAEQAPTNTPGEFPAFCGTLGLGRLLAEGRLDLLGRLRALACDPRWRIREAVAMALQRLGAVDMEALLEEMEAWSEGSPLEQRAAAAGICEPALLQDRAHVVRVLRILDTITASMVGEEDRRSEAFRALRKGLGYCWSVAVAAYPDAGRWAMEKWFGSEDRDVRWVMRQNLRKKRLMRMDAEWVAAWVDRMATS